MNRVITSETPETHWYWLYKLSGTTALMAGIIFLIPIIDFIITGLQPGPINSWLAQLQDNWLVVIFKLHAGFKGVGSSWLYELNFLDIAIMVLIGIMFIGLYAALRKTSKIWSLIALVQPVLGIALFIVTKSAGRSGIMGAALVISIVMLRSNLFNKNIAYSGILSSMLLLIGDFSVGITHSDIIAFLIGFGYVLFTTWFFLIAQRLFQLERDTS